jgi:hypothetical protein
MYSQHRGPKPKIKPLNDALSLAAYSGQKRVSYALVQGPLSNQVVKVKIQIPISIAYRLYYLGRAFDGQAVKVHRAGWLYPDRFCSVASADFRVATYRSCRHGSGHKALPGTVTATSG